MRRTRLSTQRVTGGALVGVLGLLLASCGHPGGDPGGVILGELTSVAQGAVPPHSTDVSSTTKETGWVGSCDNEYFKRGWSEVGVTVQFTSRDSDAKMRSEVSRWMLAHGWRASTPDTTGPTWTRRLRHGVTATARLSYGYDYPPEVIPPAINVTAPPEAPVGECAGG